MIDYLAFCLLTAILVLGLLCQAAFGAWAPLPNFQSNLNISNVIWNYTSGTFNEPAAYVAVRIDNALFNPGQINITGYSSSYISMGTVPFYLLQFNGTNSVILLPKSTLKGNWNTATIFFNPIAGSAPNRELPSANLFVNTYKGQTVTMFNLNLSNTRNASMTTYYSGSNSLNFNFTMDTIYAGMPGYGFVLLSNNSLQTRTLNITWYPNEFNTYNIIALSDRYFLYSLGLGQDFVSSPGISSRNANYIFLNRTSGGGFEAYFDEITNTVNGEGLGQGDGHIFNSTTPNGVATNLNLKNQFFSLSSDLSVPTQFYVIPAFTTNYIASNVFTNDNPPSGVTCPVANQTSLYCYDFKISMRNLHWNYTQLSNATGNVLDTSPIVFSFNSVGYSKIFFPQRLEMGLSCTSLYLRAYSNISGSFDDLGPVPYTVVNCTGSTVELIVPNVTSGDDTYNDLEVFYGGQNAQGETPAVVNDWNFASGNYIKYFGSMPPLTPPGPPFVINISSVLSQSSVISYSYSDEDFPSNISFTTKGAVSEMKYVVGSTTAYANYSVLPRGFLLVPGSFGPQGSGISNIITKYQTYISGPPNADFITILNTTLSHQEVGDFDVLGPLLSVSLFNGITANLYYLWANNTCGFGQVSCVTAGRPGFSNSTTTIPSTHITTTLVPTSNGINYTSSTTIAIEANVPMTSLGDSGVEVPTALLVLMGIVAFLLFAGLHSADGRDHIVSILGLVLIWVMSLFVVQLLFIAVAATLGIIAEEMIESRLPKKGGEHAG